uniref:Aspergillus nuclease S(1) n=1 Tax=Eucampia antarctica TaxID=49252 RepID=A0A7S2W9L2_9STRA|mmetsp:Transcript_24186/g.23233  ORF Transcript_24186/g.23233 Transcript_24186/m.23233 type:complete len:205 (+) Transcript_24186:137-751(+)
MRSLVIWLCLCVDVSEGWGKVGHEIVGNLAYELLSKEAKSAVDDLLDVEVLKESETTMGAVASWADKVRFTSEFHWTTPLHYVDIRDVDMKDGCVSPEKCHFEYKRDCTHDMCAVAAISDISSLLTSHLRGKSQLNKITKKQALKFLIHFIGDIHQPLHVSRQSDRGGNEIHVSLPIKPQDFCIMNEIGPLYHRLICTSFGMIS